MSPQKIEELSRVFVPYRTFPVSKYTIGTPLREFQAQYPGDRYSAEIDAFLKLHNYEPTQRGADLPWWGAKFFADESGCRVMVVAQDSYAEDAGSIVFYAALFPLMHSAGGYRRYVAGQNMPKFRYASWKGVRDQLVSWGIDFDFCYITDAAKVYRNGSWKKGDYDRTKSAELLHHEIGVCSPRIIILLGGDAYYLLTRKRDYGRVVEDGKTIAIKGIDAVAAPFFIGRGRGQKNRLRIASSLIGSLIRRCSSEES